MTRARNLADLADSASVLDDVTATAAELNLLDGVTSTTAELNILDGVTSTAAELNILDGKAFLDEDNFASNSATGIASQQSIKAYVDGITTTNVTATGALNGGSITSGFGNIDNGASTITTTGLISGGSLDIDNVLINGTTIGHTDDTDLLTLASGAITVAGNIVVTGTVDGRDVAADGTTADAALPKAGGAMTGAITTNSTFDGRDVATDGTKLDGIEASADVTDATNVTAAGALMDSEVTNLAQVKAFSAADYATAAQGTLAANALPKGGGAMTGAITTNSTFDGRDVATDGTKLDTLATVGTTSITTLGTIGTGVWQGTAIASGYIAADAITGAKIADDAINSEHYADGSIDTAHIADVNVTQAKIADQAINEAKMQVSNAPTNGYALTAQSGNTGGMTWAEMAGGSTTLLVDQSITSNVNYIHIDFSSGYKRFVIQLRGIVSNSATNGGMEARMTDGSGTILTSSDEYWQRGWNDGTITREASFRYLGELNTATSYKGNFNLQIEDPLDTTTQTIINNFAWGVYRGNDQPNPGTKINTMNGTRANNGIRFFHQNSSYGANTSFSSNSVGYRMWGIK